MGTPKRLVGDGGALGTLKELVGDMGGAQPLILRMVPLSLTSPWRGYCRGGLSGGCWGNMGEEGTGL